MKNEKKTTLGRKQREYSDAARLVCEGHDLARSPQFDTFKEGHVVPVLSPTYWVMTDRPPPPVPYPSSPQPLHHNHTMQKYLDEHQKNHMHCFSNFSFSIFFFF